MIVSINRSIITEELKKVPEDYEGIQEGVYLISVIDYTTGKVEDTKYTAGSFERAKRVAKKFFDKVVQTKSWGYRCPYDCLLSKIGIYGWEYATAYIETTVCLYI